MNDLTFYDVNNGKIKLEVASTTITRFHSKYLNESLTEINSNFQYKMLMDIDFRECIIGEYYISSMRTYTLINFTS